jgi:hypothetical protein
MTPNHEESRSGLVEYGMVITYTLPDLQQAAFWT